MAISTVVAMDEDSSDWLEALRDSGPRREEAVARLHELLLRAARFEVGRRSVRLPHLRGGSLCLTRCGSRSTSG
jgi:hypothetical protein